MTEPSFELCNEPGPASNDPPCPREKGHEGEHYIWYQASNDHVMVYTFEGEAVYHMQIEGRVTAEDICAMIAYLEAVAKWAKENK